MSCEHHANDDAARRVIREALDQTLFVEAGAGTGKTSALVDRFVALVRGGTEIDRIAAVTFTEKAAAELRERVRGALEEAQDEAEVGPHMAVALESLDRAQISTIHSFAQTLLRAFSAQAGVDPDFEVQDPVSTERRMQERWRLYLESLEGNSAAEEAIDRVLSLGLQTSEIERLASDLAYRPTLAELLAANPLTAPEASWPDIGRLRAEVETVATGAPEDDLVADRLRSLLAILQALERADEDEREATIAAGTDAIGDRSRRTSISKWGSKERKEAALDVADRVSEELNELLSGLRASALAALLPFVVAFVSQEARARAREGALTFDDLIVRVRQVLRDNESARQAFRERFAALLIDEFQDTDPLQMEIALAFARARDSDPLEAGRLFLVGDPKQSIYRFRRADMAMYSRTRDEIEAAGSEFPELALNRRSRLEILHWVNAVFAPLIGEGAEPGIQPPYRKIHAHREGELRGPGVAWMGGPVGHNARGMRDEEARAIAGQCRAVISEQWQVQDRHGTVRDASYRDIAVLIPRRILLTALERELADAQVPYRVEGGSLIYRTQEVRDIINCLTAIDDPADEVAVAGALRSPAFACSDVDLAAFATDNRGRFDYLRSDLDGRDGPVAEALRILRGYHGSRHETSLASLVEKLIWERRVVEVGTIDQGDRNAFRRARFLVEQARAFERARPESLRAFVSWLERQSARMIVDHEGAGIDDDEDAVRIMTIHAAKGLEFPIVILAGLSAAPNTNEYPTYLADHAAGRVGVHAGRRGGNREFVLGDYGDLRTAESAHDEAEMGRLLYVAATRGRDHLIVSLYHRKSQRTSCAQRLIAHGAQVHAPELAEAPTVAAISGSRLAGLTVELPDGLDREGLKAERAALVTTATTRRFTSATAIKRKVDDRLVDEERERTDASEPWSRGRAGTRLGRAVHAAIQSLPLNPDDGMIEAFCRAQAVAEAIPHREAEVRRLVTWVVRESDAWGRAVAATRAIREAPFALRQDDAVLEGFVDLLIETDDGIELIDWKTDAVPAEAVEERLRQYELQAGLYVHGVQTATGRPVTSVTYVFASAKVEASPGEPAALAAAALAELSAT
ncbi:MAG: UvrD-helicase domain-containing protein [Chloroflexi bacterium]|nr:UvrD-helicase domain-containing protein [Chloroflexota bacterium]